MKNSGFIIAILSAFCLTFLLTGCPQQQAGNQSDTGNHTVTVFFTENTPTTYTVANDANLKSVGITVPTPENGYKFISFITAELEEYNLETPVTSNLTLYVMYSRTLSSKDDADNKETDGEYTRYDTRTTNGDYILRKVYKNKIDYVPGTGDVTWEKTTSRTLILEKTGANTKETDSLTVDLPNENGYVNTTTINEKVNGGTPKVTVVTETDNEGTITKVTTVDETETERNVYGENTAHYWVIKGVNELLKISKEEQEEEEESLTGLHVSTAKEYFDTAMQKDPNNDEAKMYSAVSDMVSLFANEDISVLMKDYLGLKNYPKNLLEFFTKNWTEEMLVNYADQKIIMALPKAEKVGKWENGAVKANNGITLEEPAEDNVIYYVRASLTETESDIKPAYTYSCIEDYPESQGYVMAVTDSFIYQEKKDLEYEIVTLSEAIKSLNTTVELPSCLVDNEGTYFVPFAKFSGSSKTYSLFDGFDEDTNVSSYDLYRIKGTESFNFLLPTKIRIPAVKEKADLPEGDKWFTIDPDDLANKEFYLLDLILANLIAGNQTGFNEFFDELYSCIFESQDYKNLLEKIDSITGSVSFPRQVIREIPILQIMTTVPFGKDAITLVASVLNLIKAPIELLQYYDLDQDFTMFMNTDWQKTFVSYEYKKDPTDYKEFLIDNFKTYNEEIDPLKNGFLSARNPEKLSDSKESLLDLCDNVVHVYNKVINDTEDNYSALFKISMMIVGGAYKTGVEQIKDSINNGSKFYIPETDSALITSWPSSGDKWINFKKLYEPLSANSFFEIEGDKPVFYKVVRNVDLKTVNMLEQTELAEKLSTKELFMAAVAEINEELSADYTGKTGKEPFTFISLNGNFYNTFADISSYITISKETAPAQPYVCIPQVAVAGILYHFYNKNLTEEEIDTLFANMNYMN